MPEVEVLASKQRAVMMAAAGCGKTQMIALAVANHGRGHELILTHTHAGVDAIRRRLKKFNVSPHAYDVDTIASWALRLAAAFPSASGVTAAPRNNAHYRQVYDGAANVLRRQAIRNMIRSSYSGVYVDEYQDCNLAQHALVLALADILPCRLLGDPLQAIFDFDREVVSWDNDVLPHFESIDGPSMPRRWMHGGSKILGEWLTNVRQLLMHGAPVDLGQAPTGSVQWIDGSDSGQLRGRQINACFWAARRPSETTIAIHNIAQRNHDIGRRLGGRYSCIEPIDGRDLYAAAASVGNTTGNNRAVAVIDLVARCTTQVSTELRTIRNALESNRQPRITKHRLLLEMLMSVASNSSLEPVEAAILALQALPGAITYRRELLSEFLHAVRATVRKEAPNLVEALWAVRNRTRRLGRNLPRHALGTTLLVKGLEFDHAVILDADTLDRRDLYVAMTRPRRTLTIISRSESLTPREPVAGRGPSV